MAGWKDRTYRDPLYQLVRAERMEFARHKCEVCKHDGDLECHHAGDRIKNKCYDLQKQGLLTMQDVVMLCRRCHDLYTNDARHSRNEVTRSKDDAFVVPEYKRPETGIKYVDSKDQTDWNFATSNAQQSLCRPFGPVNQDEKSDNWEAKKD